MCRVGSEFFGWQQEAPKPATNMLNVILCARVERQGRPVLQFAASQIIISKLPLISFCLCFLLS